MYYGHKPIILLDEYDTPLQEAYFNSFWDEMVSFVGAFFNNSFKTNPSLGRALLTGITRICKESIFSDLNNIDVVTQTLSLIHIYSSTIIFGDRGNVIFQKNIASA